MKCPDMSLVHLLFTTDQRTDCWRGSSPQGVLPACLLSYQHELAVLGEKTVCVYLQSFSDCTHDATFCCVVISCPIIQQSLTLLFLFYYLRNLLYNDVWSNANLFVLILFSNTLVSSPQSLLPHLPVNNLFLFISSINLSALSFSTPFPLSPFSVYVHLSHLILLCHL